jgi:drug/metabolite transporter (DMT)-like permease
MKFQGADAAPWSSYAVRLAAGCIELMPFFRRRTIPWGKAAVVALLLNIIPGTIMYNSVSHLTTGFVAICFAGTPMIAGMLRAMLRMERFSVLMVSAALVAVFGVYLMVRGSEVLAVHPLATAVCIAGVLSYAAGYVLLERWSVGRRAMVPVNLLSLLFLSPTLAIAPLPSENSVLIGCALGVAVTGLGSLIFGYLVLAIGSEKAAYTDVIIGAFAFAIGGWLDHEPINWFTLVGAAVVLMAVAARFALPGAMPSADS